VILPLIQLTRTQSSPGRHRALCCQVLRGSPVLPGDDEARTAVTARALTITAADSGTHAPGTAGLEYEESVLTGESLPGEKLAGPPAG
jgi:hypothetical protein